MKAKTATRLVLSPVIALVISCGGPQLRQHSTERPCSNDKTELTKAGVGASPENTALGRIGENNIGVGDARIASAPQIVAFDCTKVLKPVDEGCQSGNKQVPRGLRTFELGGPEGAAWNAEFLQCSVQAATPCDGPARLSLFIGNVLVREAPLTENDNAQTCLFNISRAEWEREFDTPRDLAYDTAMFRAELIQQCGSPQHAERTEDTFTAGFSRGE